MYLLFYMFKKKNKYNKKINMLNKLIRIYNTIIINNKLNYLRDYFILKWMFLFGCLFFLTEEGRFNCFGWEEVAAKTVANYRNLSKEVCNVCLHEVIFNNIKNMTLTRSSAIDHSTIIIIIIIIPLQTIPSASGFTHSDVSLLLDFYFHWSIPQHPQQW